MRKVKYPEMGSRIRQARIELGLKQKECLEPLGDITAQMLSDWEKGYVCPTITYLKNIANFYKVSLDYIVLGRQKDENDKGIRTYKDAAEYMVALNESGLFKIDGYFMDMKHFETRLVSNNYTINEFREELGHLLIAKKSMKKELFEQAVKDLIDKYDKPITKEK